MPVCPERRPPLRAAFSITILSRALRQLDSLANPGIVATVMALDEAMGSAQIIKVQSVTMVSMRLS
jgi:hypothetical protein